ncbi:MAG: hypothetical protein HC916_01580 [Coleofasciculaceae cyanobacterium SM2_1_6]|nr:hypothetical protein [Coleofasciculaceae cyanobacterium SM2_1_6]
MSVAPQPDLSLLSPEVRSILDETAAIAAKKVGIYTLWGELSGIYFISLKI